MKKLLILLLPLFLFTFQNALNAQVEKWYQEDFSNGTGGWSEPGRSPNPPEVIDNGNPFLQNTSAGGQGAGSRWVMINTSTAWTGDYRSAGIHSITMDVRHNANQPMHFQLVFSNDGENSRVNTRIVTLEANNEWQSIRFSLDGEDMSASAGTDMETVMQNVTTVRMLSNPSPAWKGEVVAATVQIDNISMMGGIDYKAYLTGDNQLPVIPTNGYGVLYFEKENDSLRVWGNLSGISSGIDSTIAGGMHIHSGVAGQNGSVVFPLNAEFNEDATSAVLKPTDNHFALTEEQEEMLDDQLLYVNVHSMDFQGGEIRGQILDGDDELFRANLHGSNEVPAIMSPAEGRVVMELDSNVLTLSGSFSKLSSALATSLAGGGHIHMALPGSSGNVEIPLNIEVDSTSRSGVLHADSNEYVLTEDQVSALHERQLYVNIHSETYQSGEIRGQIVSAASHKLFRAYLSGANEVPMVMTTAHGAVNLELLSRDSVLVFGSYNNLGSPLNTAIAGGIHLHGGMAGENAGVLFPLENVQDSETNGRLEATAYELDSSNYNLLMNRSTYVNIHTEGNGSGEIRGQVLSDVPWHFTAPMTSSQELSSAISDGFGALKAEWNGQQLILSGVIQNLSAPIATAIAGGGHIHMEMPGQNGGVAFPLNLNISEDGLNARLHPDSNVFILDDTVANRLVRRGLYANIHTESYRSGEVRGQLLFDAAVYAAAVFGGSLENPPVNTSGKGLALLEVNPLSAKVVGTISSLTAPIDTTIAGGAHIHNAIAGRNGPVVMPINISPSEDLTSARIPVMDNIYTTSQNFINLLRMRIAYLNIHTTDNRSGEVRGQILPLSSYYVIANLHGSNEVHTVDSSGMGTVVAEVNGGKAVLSGSYHGLSSPLAVNIAGGVHIHTAPVGQNGSVLTPINTNIPANDSLAGIFLPDSNMFDLGDGSFLDMIWAGLYVNVHTENYPAGELRGQLLPMINFYPDADSVQFTSSDVITLDTTSMDTRVVFEWTAAVDEDPLAYQLEWSVDSTFDSVVYRSPYTSMPRWAVADSNLLDTLMTMGYLAESDSACLMMRLRATDGSLSHYSPSQQICFTLGVRTNLEDPLQSVVKISPVPARQEITITIRNYDEFRNQPEIKAAIYNLRGQLMKQQKFKIFGSDHQEIIDIQTLPSGQYYLQLNRTVWPFIKL